MPPTLLPITPVMTAPTTAPATAPTAPGPAPATAPGPAPAQAPGPGAACCPSGHVPTINRREAEAIAEQLHALSDATRIMIVNLLASRRIELSVGAVGDAVGVAQPTASHHLKILLGQGLVQRRRAGKTVYFFVDHDAVCALPTLARAVVGC